KSAFGKDLFASKDAVRRLLSAMLGVPLGTEKQIKDALRAHEAKRWTTPLGPVQVSDASSIRATLKLPASEASKEIAWQITAKDGRVVESGKLTPSKLEAKSEHTIDGKRYREYAMPLSVALEPGRYALKVGDDTTQLVAVPKTCFMPEALSGDQKRWGVGI